MVSIKRTDSVKSEDLVIVHLEKGSFVQCCLVPSSSWLFSALTC
jgi:hypothetical protein